MNSEEKYEYWKDIALYDLETADAMLESGRYLYVVFMCQQALEKLVKGLYVLFKKEEPYRIHNIWKIFDSTFNIEKIDKKTIQNSEKYFSLFDELLAYYISERYPSYKDKLSQSVTKEKAKQILSKTKEAFLWLESLKTLEI